MRRTPLKPSRGTRIPQDVKDEVRARDGYCVGPRAGFPGSCMGPAEYDHIRASGGLGMKSPSTVENIALLCRDSHHAWKTAHGREARPLLLAWIETRSAA